jgi:hypothetical protein
LAGGFSERRTKGVRTTAVLDELARKFGRAHDEGDMTDADAEASANP